MASKDEAEKPEVTTSTDVYDTPIALGYHEGPMEQDLHVSPPLVLSAENLNSYGSSDLNTSSYYVKKDVSDDKAVKGRCGLYNLGNTCFMNSGIQCLMSNIPLMKFLFSHLQTHKEFDGTLLGQFKKLFVKIWSGQYTILHPKEFKHTLGLFHPQFQDYRQHDCQEFLALLLDTLHEQLNCRHQSSNQISGAGPSNLRQPIKFEHNIINKSEANQEQAQKDQSKKGTHSKLTIENDIEVRGEKCISSSNQKDRDMKNLIQCSVTQTSEDSNHSNVSEQSSESEQCSVIKNLKLRCSPVADPSSPLDGNFPSSGLDGPETELHQKDASSGNTEIDLQDNVGQSILIHKDEMLMKRSESLQDLKERSESIIPGKLPKSSSDIDLVKRVCLTRDEASSQEPFDSPHDISDIDVDPGLDMKGEMVLERSKPEMGSDPVNDPVILNNAVPATSVPSLEDLYAKETKTLNTNVLATEYMSDTVTTDSEKFAKTDNVSSIQEYNVEEGMIHNTIGVPCKDDSFKVTKVKDVNIRVDKKSRSPKGANSSVEISSTEKEDCFLLTNVKRMKFEGTEKNLQMQEMSKIQKEKIHFGEKAEKCLNKNRNINTLSRPADVGGVQDSDDGESETMEDQDVEGDMEVSDTEQYDPSDREDCLSATYKNYTTAEVLAAEEAWHKYLLKNDSVVVDTFQGQFKSTVVCGKCSQVSVTFEPFMYLSVPIPHAMEKQLSIILISNNATPTRYLVTVHKQDRIQNVKDELRKILNRDTQELVLAEVMNHHISRILEDNAMLRYINDYSRHLYAFEVDPCTIVDVQTDEASPADSKSFMNPDTSTGENVQTNNSDVFCQMGSFEADSGAYIAQQYDVASSAMSCETTLLTGQSNQNALTSPSDNVNMAGTGLWEWKDSGGGDGLRRRGSLETETGDTWPVVDSTTSGITGDENYRDRDLTMMEDNVVSSTSAPTMQTTPNTASSSEWKSCAICLEELTDSELMVHTTCGGTFCPPCLEMSVQHYRDSSYCCPVCSTPAEITEDFVPLADAANCKPKNRIVSIPISFRCDRDFSGAANPFMFGHPYLVSLPSNLTGEYAYSLVERFIPFQWDFTILLTDGQGLHCSRCLYMEHCNGCVVPREGDVVLRPGDNLTVCVSMVTMEELDQIGHVIDHESMKHQRLDDCVSLMDCFSAFTESEELDEHNPWFCPHCKENQQAKKTMTVWRYPDSLIIHLKRFLFHELSSTKVDNKVVFPLDTLELGDFVSGPQTKNLDYRLCSLVCHFGGANSGHYTAYSRHPVDDQWFYYNDESVDLQTPGEDEFSSTYVLFYQRKGTDEVVHIPKELDLNLCKDESDEQLAGGVPTVTYHHLADEELTLNLPTSDEPALCQASSSLSVTASTGLLNIASSSSSEDNYDCKDRVSGSDDVTGSGAGNVDGKTECVEADSTDTPFDFYS